MPEDTSALLGDFVALYEVISTYQVQVHSLEYRMSLLHSETNISDSLHQSKIDLARHATCIRVREEWHKVELERDEAVQQLDGWMNQAYSRLSTTHGHITGCKLVVCMYWTRLVLVRPAASLYSASPLKHHPTGKQWCSNPDHYSDSKPARRCLTLLCWVLSRAAEPQILTSFVWHGWGANHQAPACQANAQPLHYPAAVSAVGVKARGV